MKMKTQIKFLLGQVVATPGILGLGPAAAVRLPALLVRHSTGDWGDLDPSDWKVNDAALENGERILSAYKTAGIKVWIITERDRSVTTILLPEEY